MPVPDKYTPEMYEYVIGQLVKEVKNMYEYLKSINSHEMSIYNKEIIALDYMVTMIQLLTILKLENMELFHGKSKIQSIVDGECIREVTAEHLRLIGNKLSSLEIL